MTNKSGASTLVGILALGAVTTAQGALTFVDSRGNFGNERCLVGNAATGLCETGAYHGAVSIIRALEMDLDLPSGGLVRVDDSLDQIWQATITNGGRVLARARYASHELAFGFDAGSGYVHLIDDLGNRTLLVGNPGEFGADPHDEDFDVVGTAWVRLLPLTAGTPFAFILRDLTVNPDNYFTSNNSGAGVGSGGYRNSGGEDHMVAFRVNAAHYFVANEDLLPGQSDHDFNDMVVELKFVQPVPLPAALPLLLSGLAGIGFLRRKLARG